MSDSSLHLTKLRKAIENPTDGFVGLVDDVFSLCRQFALQLDWRANRCRVRTFGSDTEETLELSLRKSAFRAILARIATLCDEQTPGTFSPYGGQGELSLGADPKAILQITWVNTPDEQRLTVKPVQVSDKAASLHIPPGTENPSAEEIVLRAYQK